MSRRRATAGDPYAMAYVTYAEDTANLTTYTFPSASFGDAAGSREIFVLVRARGTSLTVSSVTIGGVSATVEATQYSSSTSVIACAHVAVPAGTSGDVVVTLSGGATEAAIAVYRVTGRIVAGATSTDAASGATGFAGSVSIAYDTNADGFCLAMAGFANTFTSWSPFTADHNYALTDKYVAASYNRIGLAAASGNSTLDWSGTGAGAGINWSFD